MSAMETLGLWIGLHVFLLLALKLNVGRVRSGEKISFGDDGNERMIRAIRVQGNAVEDVPILLLGLVALALMNAPALLLHGIGGGLFVSRVLHAVGLGSSSGTSFGRFIGTIGTLLVSLTTIGACLWFAFT